MLALIWVIVYGVIALNRHGWDWFTFLVVLAIVMAVEALVRQAVERAAKRKFQRKLERMLTHEE